MTSFVHIGKQIGYQVFRRNFVPSSSGRSNKSELRTTWRYEDSHGIFCSFAQLKGIIRQKTEIFYLHLFTSLYYVVRRALRNSHYYAESAV